MPLTSMREMTTCPAQSRLLADTRGGVGDENRRPYVAGRRTQHDDVVRALNKAQVLCASVEVHNQFVL